MILRGVILSNAILSNAILTEANLREANLSGADLSDAYFNGASLFNSNLSKAHLSKAHLIGSNLNSANLKNADLTDADLYCADLKDADLTGANLYCADLSNAHLIKANLSEVILKNSSLRFTRLSGTKLQNADFTHAKIEGTAFANTDLRHAKGLETVFHSGPSEISTSTLSKSIGNISEAFLRGCGLSDWEIESVKLYNPNLSNEEINDIHYKIHDLRVSRAFQINPLFISYSHKDGLFVDVIDKRLTQEGIRFWRDIHHATACRLEKQIDRAIHINDVVLLVLSKHSTNSDWVEHEVRKAREKEKKTGKDTLCPVALDDSWKTCRWPERLREQIMEYKTLDFSNWQNDNYFQKMFGKLLEGLNLFYK